MQEDPDLSQLAAMIDFSKKVEVTLSFDSSDEEDCEDIIKFEVDEDEHRATNENINNIQEVAVTEHDKGGKEADSDAIDTQQKSKDVTSCSANVIPPSYPTKPTNATFASNANCHSPLDMRFEKHGLLISLLRDLATNIITIARSRQECKAASMCGVEIFERTRAVYLKLKRHLFNVSFSTIKQIVIPNQKNEAFMNSFVKYVTTRVKASGEQINVDYWTTEINIIFNELILFTSQTQDMTNAFIQEMAEIAYMRTKSLTNSNKTLADLINSPPVLTTENTNINVNKTMINGDTCSLRFGPPNTEITITYNRQVLNPQIQPNTDKTSELKQCLQRPMSITDTLRSRRKPQKDVNRKSPVKKNTPSTIIPPPVPPPPPYNNHIATAPNNNYYNMGNNHQSTVRNCSPPNKTADQTMQNSLHLYRKNSDQAKPTLPLPHKRFTGNVNNTVPPGNLYLNYIPASHNTDCREPMQPYQSNMIQNKGIPPQHHPNRYYPYPYQNSWNYHAMPQMPHSAQASQTATSPTFVS